MFNTFYTLSWKIPRKFWKKR